jgi:hypothetical protein
MPALEAIASAARFARGYGLSGRAFERSILAVTHETVPYQRALYVIQRRSFVVRTSPGLGTRPSQVVPLPSTVGDAWAVAPQGLPASTRRVSECPKCRGEKQLACSACEGLGRSDCGSCRGAGRVQGQRGMKNCPDCRGQGTQKCLTCSRGKVTCPSCAGSSRVFAWLEVLQEERQQIVTDGDALVLQHHPGLHTGADFDATSWNARLLCDAAASKPIHEALAPELDAVRERVLSARVQSFELDRYDVACTIGTGTASLTVVGLRSAVDSCSNITALRKRRSLAIAATSVVGIPALMAIGKHTSQHHWYLMNGGQGVLLGLALVGSLITLATVLEATLIQAVRRIVLVWAGIAVILALGVTFTLACARNGPTLARARSSWEAGARESAREEAEALVAMGIDVAGASVLLDEMQLRELNASQLLATKSQIASRTWHASQNRRFAIETVKAAALGQIRSSGEKLEPIRADEIRVIVAWLPPEDQSEIEAELAFCNLARCAGSAPVDCLLGSVSAARQKHVAESRMAPLLLRATNALQSVIDESLTPKPSQDLRTRRDNLTRAVSASLVMQEAGNRVSRPPPDELRARSIKAERGFQRQEAELARLAVQKARRLAQAQVAETKRLEAAALRRHSTGNIKQRIIQASIDEYSGNCPCPYNTASNGSSCGGRSAHSRAGGYSPICYASEVTQEMVEQYRRSHQD